MLVADATRYINKAVSATVVRMYMDMIRVTPAVWSYVYRQAEKAAIAETGRQELAAIIRTLSATQVTRLLQGFRPDTIVCTHPFPLAMVAELKRRAETDVRLVAVITDFTVHPFWIYQGVDYYALASESLLTSSPIRSLPDEMLWVTGIPIDPSFSDPVDVGTVRAGLGFGPDDRVALVMGGGIGLGPMEKVVQYLLKETGLKVIAVAGRNPGLVDSLRRAEARYPGRIRVFGYVRRVHTLMSVSDILVSKAGGLTASEAAAKGLPMVILSPIPGQEQRNADFLVTRGAAVRVDSAFDAAVAARQVLERPRLFNVMRKACLEIGRPRAALDLAKMILGE